MRVGADRAAEFADAHAFQRLREPLLGPAEFVVHERELQSERDRLGVDAVAAADHRRRFEIGAPGRRSRARSSRMSSSRIPQASLSLHRKRGVENVGGRQALMHPARGRADRRRDVFEKRDDIVIRALLDFDDLRESKSARAWISAASALRDLARARPSPRRRAFRSRARFRICAARTRVRASGRGNNDQSPREHRKAAARGKVIRGKKKSPGAIEAPERRAKSLF